MSDWQSGTDMLRSNRLFSPCMVIVVALLSFRVERRRFLVSLPKAVCDIRHQVAGGGPRMRWSKE